MWNMIADKYSHSFYASRLCEFSDKLKKKKTSFSIYYLLIYKITRMLRWLPPPYLPDSMQCTTRTHPAYIGSKWKHW